MSRLPHKSITCTSMVLGDIVPLKFQHMFSYAFSLLAVYEFVFLQLTALSVSHEIHRNVDEGLSITQIVP